jgi:hypothetical protein
MEKIINVEIDESNMLKIFDKTDIVNIRWYNRIGIHPYKYQCNIRYGYDKNPIRQFKKAVKSLENNCEYTIL